MVSGVQAAVRMELLISYFGLLLLPFQSILAGKVKKQYDLI